MTKHKSDTPARDACINLRDTIFTVIDEGKRIVEKDLERFVAWVAKKLDKEKNDAIK